MHLLLSFPDHLAAEAEFIASTPVDATGDPTGDTEGTATETSQTSDEDDDEEVGAAGVILQLGIFILIPVAMYFLLIRPRRRMMKEQQAVQRSIEVGDEVLLTSGMYGFITGFEEGSDVVWVEVDDDVQVRVTRAGISGKVTTSASSSASASATAAADAPPASPSSEVSGRPTLKGGSRAAKPDSVETAEPVAE